MSRLTQVQFDTQRSETLQHSELEFVSQRLCVDGPGASADLRLLHQRGSETRQNLLRHAFPEEITTRLPQNTQHLREREIHGK